MKTPEKTNVMRVLESRKLPYKAYSYDSGGVAITGLEVAQMLGQNPEQVFKTLVTTGRSGAHYVFVIPVGAGLDLKKAAKAVGEKSLEMLKQKDLLPLTGYVHGGCSPIGMKKQYRTFFDSSAELLPTIMVSAGKIGSQVELAPAELVKLTRGAYADLVSVNE